MLNINTWCYYHLKEECLKFHSDLKYIRCAPHVWHGRCPGDTPIPTKPSQACLLRRSQLRCWFAVTHNSGSVFGTGETYTLSLTKPHRKKSHTVRSGDRGGQVQNVLSVAGLRFFREMAVVTIGPFQMLRSLCVIDTYFTILRHFLLKLWRNEILR